ncbi:MAG: hypothetical protein WBA10_00025, partial [Elainellaceae cyanobacterium]
NNVGQYPEQDQPKQHRQYLKEYSTAHPRLADVQKMTSISISDAFGCAAVDCLQHSVSPTFH